MSTLCLICCLCVFHFDSYYSKAKPALTAEFFIREIAAIVTSIAMTTQMNTITRSALPFATMTTTMRTSYKCKMIISIINCQALFYLDDSVVLILFLIHLQSKHSISSDPSLQFGVRSHLRQLGIQEPSEHVNSAPEQASAKENKI